jgi:hypothetical protein
MNPNQLLSLVEGGEGQTLEFKESLTSGRRREGIETLVAFANRDGGQVLFGINDQGHLTGANVGKNTLENLASEIARATYPTLPVHIETVRVAGKTVVLAESSADRPPVIGFYAYSSTAIDPDSYVATKDLQAFRRVGRVNQRVDFMWLRQNMPSDPKLRLNVYPSEPTGSNQLPEKLFAQVWIEQPSASAHYIELLTEPPVYTVAYYVFDLPVPQRDGEEGPFRIETSDSMELALADDATANAFEGDLFSFVATYRDDFGLTWEVRRGIYVGRDEDGVQLYPIDFSRRISDFPPERGIGGS